MANNIHVYVEDYNFTCLIKQGGSLVRTWCVGTYGGGEIRYVNEDCIGDSAFIHEVLHLLNSRVENYSDYDHVRVRFFGEDDWSLEHIINEHVKDELCPSCW